MPWGLRNKADLGRDSPFLGSLPGMMRGEPGSHPRGGNRFSGRIMLNGTTKAARVEAIM